MPTVHGNRSRAGDSQFRYRYVRECEDGISLYFAFSQKWVRLRSNWCIRAIYIFVSEKSREKEKETHTYATPTRNPRLQRRVYISAFFYSAALV